jgi:hypothetical protein
MFQSVSKCYWSCICFFKGPSSLAESEAVCSELNVRFCVTNRHGVFKTLSNFFKVLSCKLDIHESVHRDTITKTTNNVELYRLIYYPLSALHFSGDVFTHHQEHVTVFTVIFTNVTASWCHRCVGTPAGSEIDEYYQML